MQIDDTDILRSNPTYSQKEKVKSYIKKILRNRTLHKIVWNRYEPDNLWEVARYINDLRGRINQNSKGKIHRNLSELNGRKG